MNEVFIIGKVITEVKFDFILNSKHISIARFGVMTMCDKQEINVITYDEKGRLCLCKFETRRCCYNKRIFRIQ